MLQLTLLVEYEMGEIVYIKTDTDQRPRQVIGYTIGPDLTVDYYTLQSGTMDSNHYGIELSREKDVTITTNN